MTVDARKVMMSEGEERKGWVKAIQEELDSIDEKEVKVDMNDQDVYEQYQSQGMCPVKLPAKIVLTQKPLHDGKGGFKRKARICVCGNFEKEMSENLYNRSEVPTTFEMRIMLALSEGLGWDVGALDIRVAFLNARLRLD